MLDNVKIIRDLDDITNLDDVKFFLPVKCFDSDGSLIGFELLIYLENSPEPHVFKADSLDFFLATFKSFLSTIPKSARGSTAFVTKQFLP